MLRHKAIEIHHSVLFKRQFVVPIALQGIPVNEPLYVDIAPPYSELRDVHGNVDNRFQLRERSSELRDSVRDFPFLLSRGFLHDCPDMVVGELSGSSLLSIDVECYLDSCVGLCSTW
jgi:hypothetical protein